FMNATASYGNFGTVNNYPAQIMTNSIWRMRINTNGTLNMSDGGSYNGTWNPASSRELKENIENLTTDDAIGALEGLNPVKYNYKAHKEDARVGFIAEDVPELVAMNGRKNLGTVDILAVLTKVVQEQQKTISELKKKIAELEKK
ncbi:MAG: tail fiber domain-containing protein, partial [Candidatus Aminicenantes bacterium]